MARFNWDKARKDSKDKKKYIDKRNAQRYATPVKPSKYNKKYVDIKDRDPNKKVWYNCKKSTNPKEKTEFDKLWED